MNSARLPVRVLCALLAASLLALMPGCVVVAAGAAGAGAVAWVRGELDATLGNRYDAVARATDRALADLKYAKISERLDALEGEITARTAMDKKIAITLNKTGDNLTRVRIRVGVFGDEQISRALLDRIKADL